MLSSVLYCGKGLQSPPRCLSARDVNFVKHDTLGKYTTLWEQGEYYLFYKKEAFLARGCLWIKVIFVILEMNETGYEPGGRLASLENT